MTGSGAPEEGALDRTEWEARWEAGRIAFHQAQASDFLATYAERAWGSESPGRILVPLCGKSLDMVFLADRGAEVVGVEFVEQAVVEFFGERGLTPTVERGPLASYRAGNYRLFSADIFEVSARVLGPLDGVFDRAALVALDPESRRRYASHLSHLLPRGGRMLLVSFEYDQAAMAGPPFAVLPNEVDRLFGGDFDITHLDTQDLPAEEFGNQRLSALRESAFVLTRTQTGHVRSVGGAPPR